MPELSILIVSWNVKDFVLTCISSIVQQTQHLNYEIILIDNASNDKTSTAVRHEFPQVKIIQNKVNVGFAVANNTGLAQAKGRYLLFLNPDTKLTENTFQKITTTFETNIDIGAIGCKLINGDGKLDYQCAKNLPTISNHIFEPYVAKIFPNLMKSFILRNWDHESNREVELLSGACLAIRREVYNQISGFTTNMFMYVEDVDYCYRIRMAGWKLFYLAETEIIHYGGQSTIQHGQPLQAENIRNLRKFFTKYRSGIYGYSYEILALLENTIKYPLLIILNRWLQKYSDEDIQKHRRIVVDLLRKL